ncbi:MAG: hypothetical protein ACOC1X_02405 [Promethearchaeota archaeon]
MILERLKERPKHLYILITTGIGFLTFILINQLVFASLSRTFTEYGILDFEFAWTKNQILLIFSVWGEGGKTLQAAGIYWDFPYILGYVSFIFGCNLLVLRQLEGNIQKIGFWVLLTPILAGIFDVIENIHLLWMIITDPNFPSYVPLIASISALIKFGLLGVGIVFFFIILILFIVNKLKKE